MRRKPVGSSETPASGTVICPVVVGSCYRDVKIQKGELAKALKER